MLKGKCVVLGVTGSIAAYKIAYLASALVKQHADVHVIMTENATNFINPITFETLTSNKCLVDTFDRNFQFNVEHVALAKRADIFMVAPASANVIGKMANGIADDMLTTTILAAKCPKYVSPAMNTNMFENPIVQDNIKKLGDYGFHIIDPASGYLACGDTGAGKMPEPETLFEYILQELACKKDLAGKKVLVTAGPTREAIDPVRYITNHSSGKMGMAIAEAAVQRGALVTLIAGRMSVDIPDIFEKVIRVKSTGDMLEAVMNNYEENEFIVKAAAPADYRVKNFSIHKIKAKELSLELEKTPDIAKAVGAVKGDRKLIIFSAETDDLIENARKKLAAKNADMVVANDVTKEGAGFNVDTNIATIITKAGKVYDYDIMPKSRLAEIILDHMHEL